MEQPSEHEKRAARLDEIRAQYESLLQQVDPAQLSPEEQAALAELGELLENSYAFAEELSRSPYPAGMNVPADEAIWLDVALGEVWGHPPWEQTERPAWPTRPARPFPIRPKNEFSLGSPANLSAVRAISRQVLERMKPGYPAAGLIDTALKTLTGRGYPSFQAANTAGAFGGGPPYLDLVVTLVAIFVDGLLIHFETDSVDDLRRWYRQQPDHSPAQVAPGDIKAALRKLEYRGERLDANKLAREVNSALDLYLSSD